jgi:hypothetical protein
MPRMDQQGERMGKPVTLTRRILHFVMVGGT